MNTIPSSSKTLSYTIYGNQQGFYATGALKPGIILLNRGGWLFRAETLERLSHLDAAQIICVEQPPFKLDFEDLSQKFSKVTFLLLSSHCTPGQAINLAAQEIRSDYFFVLWDNQSLNDSSYLKLSKEKSSLNKPFYVPELRDPTGAVVPSLAEPVFQKSQFGILFLTPEEETSQVLYPYDFTGCYDKKAFMLSGGFREELANPYWQALDWGVRMTLWGEKIQHYRGIRVDYVADPPIADQSSDISYQAFFLYNLTIRFNGNYGEIPLNRFFSFWKHSGLTLFQAWRKFRQTRKDVWINRYRYKSDMKHIMDCWGDQN